MKFHSVLLLAACIALSACFSRGGRSPAAVAPAAVPAAVPTAEMTASLDPTTSPVNGTVRLRPGVAATEVRATVQIRGSVGGLSHRWEIRSGACSERGAELAPVSTYRTLDVRPDGTAELTVTVPIRMPLQGTHHVNVLRSRNDDTVIACGLLNVE